MGRKFQKIDPGKRRSIRALQVKGEAMKIVDELWDTSRGAAAPESACPFLSDSTVSPA